MSSNNDILNKVLAPWTQRLPAPDIEAGLVGCYVFGSLVYQDGSLFDNERSDIDLLFHLSDNLNFADRCHLLHRLQAKKSELEIDLLKFLKRSDASVAICSVLPITQREIDFGVHKDGHIEFFKYNFFSDLSRPTDDPRRIFFDVTTKNPDRLLHGIFLFTQKIRNSYLSLSPNLSGGLVPYGGTDLFPKAHMRAAAMARAFLGCDDASGKEWDLKEGLNFIVTKFFEFITNGSLGTQQMATLRPLSDKLKARMLDRGNRPELDPLDQLLLAEFIFELAVLKFDSPNGKEVAPTLFLKNSESSSGTTVSTVRTEGHGSLSKITVKAIPRLLSPWASNEFFNERLRKISLGTPGLLFSSEKSHACEIIEKILSQPLKTRTGSTPLWWWRGLQNLHIWDFSKLDTSTYLLNNIEELDIEQVAIFRSSNEVHDFAYVRVAAMQPTGLYERHSSDSSGDLNSTEGEPYSEEYAIFRGTKITRQDYDSGYAVIDGETTDLLDEAKLRIRHLTPYNFLLAAHSSPINTSSFDHELKALLNKALIAKDEERIVRVISEKVRKLPIGRIF